ncbi:hypothetical protein [Paenibacillus planticolens]|uniref:Uncharacterized protein n=1 Tax=Paenibacillus planticolens TaxID=2654976 RepID=A0ABX1ZK18_9BACL|nr:hypothetical protein [Paenibacillus planticolens]NOV00336.1 hypothetical protein [Paenibacillus planticolens]
MELVYSSRFVTLNAEESLLIDAGWGWAETFAVVGAAALIVGTGIVVAASAPISIPVAVAIGATTGKAIALAGTVTLGVSVASL